MTDPTARLPFRDPVAGRFGNPAPQRTAEETAELKVRLDKLTEEVVPSADSREALINEIADLGETLARAVYYEEYAVGYEAFDCIPTAQLIELASRIGAMTAAADRARTV